MYLYAVEYAHFRITHFGPIVHLRVFVRSLVERLSSLRPEMFFVERVVPCIEAVLLRDPEGCSL